MLQVQAMDIHCILSYLLAFTQYMPCRYQDVEEAKNLIKVKLAESNKGYQKVGTELPILFLAMYGLKNFK